MNDKLAPLELRHRPDGLVNLYIAGTQHEVALCVRPADADRIVALWNNSETAAADTRYMVRYREAWMKAQTERDEALDALETVFIGYMGDDDKDFAAVRAILRKHGRL